jgi:hypothetical protein
MNPLDRPRIKPEAAGFSPLEDKISTALAAERAASSDLQALLVEVETAISEAKADAKTFHSEARDLSVDDPLAALKLAQRGSSGAFRLGCAQIGAGCLGLPEPATLSVAVPNPQRRGGRPPF